MEAVKKFVAEPSFDGSGSGSGYGYGYGSGYGYGYGSGSGSGDGSGDGSGYGYGDGAGDGYGYGYGAGYGYGDGDGDDITMFNGEVVWEIDGVPTIVRRARENIAKGVILNLDLTLTPCFIAKCNGRFAHGGTLREAQEALREKLFDGMDEDERIGAFLQEIAPRKRYPVMIFFDWHHRLTGSCEFGRKQFAKDHRVDLTGEMTVEEFIELTKSAYGGSTIRKLEERIRNGEIH